MKLQKSNILKCSLMAIFLLSAFLLTGCNEETVVENVDETKTTIIKNSNKNPEECTVNEAAYIFAGKLEDFQSYQIDVTGAVEANKGFINFTQNIDNVIFKNGDESYSESVSESSLVNSIHQAFFKDDKVVYRNAKEGAYTVGTVQNYKNVYGVIPTENIFGFIFNDQTIVFSERKESQDNYAFRYVLDGTKATTLVARQAKEFGTLMENPSYQSIEITIVIDKDWKPISMETTCNYTISKAFLGEFECTQELEYTFSKWEETISIPNAVELNNQIGSTPTTITPTEIIDDSVMGDLIDSISNIDITNGLVASGFTQVVIDGQTISLPIVLEMKLDSELNLNSEESVFLKVSTYVMGKEISLYYCNDQKIYLALGDKKIYVSVNDSVALEDISTDMIDVKKSENGFDIALNVETINEMLTQVGISFTKINFNIEVNASRPCVINIDASSSVGTIAGELLITEKTFDSYIKKDEYTALDTSFEFTPKLAIYVGGQLPCDAFAPTITINLTGDNIIDANLPINTYQYEVLMMFIGMAVDQESEFAQILVAGNLTDIGFTINKSKELTISLIGYVSGSETEKEVKATEVIDLSGALSGIEISKEDIIEMIKTASLTVNAEGVTIDVTSIANSFYSDLIHKLEEMLEAQLPGMGAAFLASMIPTSVTDGKIFIVKDDEGNIQLSLDLKGESMALPAGTQIITLEINLSEILAWFE